MVNLFGGVLGFVNTVGVGMCVAGVAYVGWPGGSTRVNGKSGQSDSRTCRRSSDGRFVLLCMQQNRRGPPFAEYILSSFHLGKSLSS